MFEDVLKCFQDQTSIISHGLEVARSPLGGRQRERARVCVTHQKQIQHTG